jgi:chromosome segregation ATPase
MVKEEYEVIPLDPIRALEKRVKKIEESIQEKSVGNEYIELVKTNQQVVADLIRLNTGIIDKLNNLASKIEELVKSIDEFLNKFEIEIENGGKESKRVKELEEENQRLREAQEELLDKISKLEKRINALILSKVPVRRTNIPITQQPQQMRR